MPKIEPGSFLSLSALSLAILCGHGRSEAEVPDPARAAALGGTELSSDDPFSRTPPLRLALADEPASALRLAVVSSSANAPAPAAAQASAADSAAQSAATAPVDSEPLLPAILSPGEKIMWGEHGLMRHFGFPLTEEGREKEISLRRTMLTVHETGGFITLAAMLATVVYGQLTLDGHTSLGQTHKTFADITIGTYFFTAAMSLLSPPPMIRRNEWNTVSIHKGLAIIHFTGMILTPLLADGIAMRERSNGVKTETINRDKAHIHQVSGYITTAAFASAMAVIMF